MQRINGDTCCDMLLVPKQDRKCYPLAIVLQGHTTGDHISVGEKRFEGDERFFPNSCFALQAVKQSYATVQKIYDRADAENNCKLVVMPEGHFWCPEEAWAAIGEELTQLGW